MQLVGRSTGISINKRSIDEDNFQLFDFGGKSWHFFYMIYRTEDSIECDSTRS
jgi:hypothetical protein